MARQKKIPQMKDIDVNDLISGVQTLMNEFMESKHITAALTGRERMRLISAGVNNYGFIGEVFNIARDNPQFMPPFFSMEEMAQGMKNFEQIRQLGLVLAEFSNIVSACLLVNGDKRFREALRVYDSLKEMTKNRVPGAQPLFDSLRTFFQKHRGSAEHEPTIKKLERDSKKLLHGTANGRIEIVNESSKSAAGIHKVADNMVNT